MMSDEYESGTSARVVREQQTRLYSLFVVIMYCARSIFEAFINEEYVSLFSALALQSQ